MRSTPASDHSQENSLGTVPLEAVRPRILVVDDQAINIQTLYQIFSPGCEVFMATSGAQALIAAKQQAPDLILLDVLMPDMDGHEVCKRLKDTPETQEIPVIFVTAQDDPQEETLGLQLGAVDFIRKPVNAAVVRARVQTQLALRQLKQNLQHEVALRTADLQAALHRLQLSQEQLVSSEAKATLSTLIASVSHELSTPIGNGVMMASSMADQVTAFARNVAAGTLKRSDLDQFVANQAEASAMVLRNLQRATDMLGNFRQVAADQASEQCREFDLATVVAEVISTLTPTLRRHTHRVVVDIPGGIVMHAQPGPLGQVVINLINNAYLHAFEGRTEGQLTIRAERRGEQVLIQVDDNGVGIAQENLERLFEPFFSTKIGKGGTGLGMAIVKNLVEKNLGGEVTVQSTVGEGTRFEIVLPLRS